MIESATAFAASSGRISDAAETSPYLRHVVSRGAGDEDGDAEEAQPQAADP
jgi:hypothetical protein